MKVRVHHRGHAYGNILWDNPVRVPIGSRPPKGHPLAGTPHPLHMGHATINGVKVDARTNQPESADALGRFRARGYYASCFPEGDGLCFDPPEGATPEQVVRDIEECFGWEVEVVT